MRFKEITIDSIKELQPYFDLVDYEACEYCFTTLYMWQHVYKTGYIICDDFAVIMAEYEGNSFSILPLAKKEKLPQAIDFIVEYFKESNKKICFRGITKEVVYILQQNYPDKFEYIEERDLFDYVYDGESLRTLGGRKNQKKRNHINAFLKDYEGRIWVISDNSGFIEKVMQEFNEDSIDLIDEQYFDTAYKTYKYNISLIEKTNK